jgi:hypothetical protein
MPSFTDVMGLASATAATAAVVLALPGIAGFRRAYPGLGTAVVVTLAPLGALPTAAYVRGVIGDLSITTMVVLLRSLLRPVFRWGPIDAKSGLAVQVLVAVGGLALYPPALGLGPFDPYRLGYGDPWLMFALLLLAMAAWFLGFHLVTLCIVLAVLAHAAGSYESRNLWDYLLDPLVSTWGLCALLLRGARAIPSVRSGN